MKQYIYIIYRHDVTVRDSLVQKLTFCTYRWLLGLKETVSRPSDTQTFATNYSFFHLKICPCVNTISQLT
jgi:hypothetical protein